MKINKGSSRDEEVLTYLSLIVRIDPQTGRDYLKSHAGSDITLPAGERFSPCLPIA